MDSDLKEDSQQAVNAIEIIFLETTIEMLNNMDSRMDIVGKRMDLRKRLTELQNPKL